jgi:hypothetical protein
MRILFGAGNFIGSNLMLSRFLQHAQDHEVRIAAYYRNSKYLTSMDWCLDALSVRLKTNYFKDKYGISGPPVDHFLTDMIINDLLEWGPELVISDCEFFTATVAKILEIPLWYCSPMLQLTGIDHERQELKNITDTTKKYLDSLPKGDAYLVYSPLCDISSRPILKNGYEWVRPYMCGVSEFSTEDINIDDLQKLIPDNSLVTTGETSLVSDCLYSGKSMFISPNPLEVEQVLNAQLLQWYGVGVNIGRSTNMGFIKRQVEKKLSPPILSIQKWSQLDEKLSICI